MFALYGRKSADVRAWRCLQRTIGCSSRSRLFRKGLISGEDVYSALASLIAPDCPVPPIVGRKTRKDVAEAAFPRRLRKLIRPSYFCTMPLLIQSPRPVPLVDL